MRRAGALVLVLALLVGNPGIAGATPQPSCGELDAFSDALLAVGERWIIDTQRAGVGFTADPTRFDAQDWHAFGELVTAKRDGLRAITPPAWLAAWLAVQIDAAELQIKAADAATLGGLAELAAYSEDFSELLARDDAATAAAVERCPAFAPVASSWRALDRDFEPAPATPVARVDVWRAVLAAR